MDFWKLANVLVRRWTVVVPILMLIGGLTATTVIRMRPTYVATAFVQLIPPVTIETDAWRHNPWLNLGTETIGNAAVVTLTDRRTSEELLARGYSDSFTVTLDQQRSMVTFEVVGSSQGQVRQTAVELISRFTATIVTLQNAYGVPPTDVISAHRLDGGTNIVKSTSQVTRALLALAAAGCLATLGATLAYDTWYTRHRRKDRHHVPGPAEGNSSA